MSEDASPPATRPDAVGRAAGERPPAARGGGSDAPVRPYAVDRAMPADFAITVAAKGSTDRLLAADQGPRRQDMCGFEETYVDIVDYIVRVTHRIWEEKDIGYIYETYRHNARVTDDRGLQYGRDKIVADTVQTINAFPDVRLYADEVIWAGDDKVGFCTSHRTVIVGHNTGHSKYGQPTGRKVVVWAIANCRTIQNEIFEEWVLYNDSSLLLQLGFDLHTLARTLGNETAAIPLDELRLSEVERALGQEKPEILPDLPLDRFEVEGFLRHLYHQIWNWRNLSAVTRGYSPTIRYHGPSNREFYGRGDLRSFFLSIIAMFPDLVFQIDDVYWMGNDDDGYLTSVRWSIIGTHQGHGIYGTPTGRRIGLWGISQHRIIDRRIVEEWTVFNEFDVMQQIYRDRPQLAVG